MAQTAVKTSADRAALRRALVEDRLDLVATDPARTFGVQERGFLREGYWADLVLVNETCRGRRLELTTA